MIQLDQKYVQVFTPHIVSHSLEAITKNCNWFVDAFGEPAVTQALKKLQVSFKSSGIGEDDHGFDTPLGALKIKFIKRYEDLYLGVAACFSYVNSKNEDEQFFVVYMNHRSPWIDSTGHEFSIDFSTDLPELLQAPRLIQRVLGALLQLKEKELISI